MSPTAATGIAAGRQASSAEDLPTQYLTFRIAGEMYGVRILNVKEILQYDTVTRVPSTPRSIRGVMNLRGSVVPVVDLAVKFGLAESEVTRRTCVVIVEVALEGNRTVMGVMADAVNEVVDLHAKDVEPPPPFGPRVKVDYLLGMGRIDRSFLLLLDIERILSAEEMELLADAEQMAGKEAVDPVAGARPASAKQASAAESVTLPDEVIRAGGKRPAKRVPGSSSAPPGPRGEGT